MIFMNMYIESTPIGISLPKEIVRKIDIDREDISRSKYLLRLIQRAYAIENQTDVEKKQLQTASRVGHSSQSGVLH